jgi:hypothetical protein
MNEKQTPESNQATGLYQTFVSSSHANQLLARSLLGALVWGIFAHLVGPPMWTWILADLLIIFIVLLSLSSPRSKTASSHLPGLWLHEFLVRVSSKRTGVILKAMRADLDDAVVIEGKKARWRIAVDVYIAMLLVVMPSPSFVFVELIDSLKRYFRK